AAEDELHLAARLGNQRRHIRARAVRAVCSPALGTSVLVQGNDPGDGVLITIQDDHVLVQNRWTAKTMLREELPRRGLPDLLPLKIVASDDHFLPCEEAHIDVSAVRGRGRARVAIERMLAFEWRLHHVALPEQLAIGPIQAEQEPSAFLFQTSRDEDAI